MQQETHNSSNSTNKNFFDDDIVFKPLTEGLGFHQKEKTVYKKSQLKRTPIKKKKTPLKAETLQSPALEKENVPTDNGSDVLIPGIEEFYGKQLTTSVEQRETIRTSTIVATEIQHALLYERFLAWGVDVVVILLATLVTAILASSPTFFLKDETMFPIMSSIQLGELVSLVAPLGAIYYLFYFTLAERSFGQSLGKKVMSIKVLGANKKLSLVAHFTRSLLTLCSVIFLGLPAVLKIQDKLTGSIVIQE